MALNRYGVLKGRAVRFEAERRGESTPHFHIFLDADGRSFDASVNVKSRASPSELVFHQALRFEHPVTRGLAETASGFRELARTPQGGGLDYMVGTLLDDICHISRPVGADGVDDDSGPEGGDELDNGRCLAHIQLPSDR